MVGLHSHNTNTQKSAESPVARQWRSDGNAVKDRILTTCGMKSKIGAILQRLSANCFELSTKTQAFQLSSAVGKRFVLLSLT